MPFEVKILAPMIAPTPKATRPTGPKVRFNASGVEEAFSAKISGADLNRKSAYHLANPFVMNASVAFSCFVNFNNELLPFRGQRLIICNARLGRE